MILVINVVYKSVRFILIRLFTCVYVWVSLSIPQFVKPCIFFDLDAFAMKPSVSERFQKQTDGIFESGLF